MVKRPRKQQRVWRKVVFASQCDDDGNCPRCEIDYAECACPGPMQEDVYEYQERRDGSLWARARALQ